MSVDTGRWPELVAAAVLGTERRPFPGPAAGHPAAAVVSEDADLGAWSAAVWAYMESGRTVGAAAAAPGATGAAGDPGAGGPVDPRPLVSEGAAATLAAIVEDARFRAVLGEWLGLAAGHGRRLPPEHVPAVLDLTSPADRDLVRAAGGPVVDWLAETNPRWAGPADGSRLARAILSSDGAAGEDEDHWIGPDDERVAAFRIVRGADPDRARQLARRVWRSEPPTTRAAMVGAMVTGLSGEDEPFLEACLDDRRKDVRRVAADLLARLPGSRLSGRMAGRSRGLVRVEGRHRPGWQLAAPPPPDARARRDGIGAGRSGPSAEAAWLAETVGATPLDTWADQLRLSPTELVDSAARAGRAPLLQGWARAAERQADREWAAVLVAAGQLTTGLLALVPGETADAAIERAVAAPGLVGSVGLLLDLPRPWSPAVTRAVLAAAAATIRAAPGRGQPALRQLAALRDALPAFGLAADPGGAAAASDVLVALESLPAQQKISARPFWGRPVATLVALVHFRQAMYQEFQ